MLVTLIDPYIITRAYNISTSTSLPLGIAYLAAYLNDKKVDVEIIDSIGEGINKVSFYNKDFIKWGLNEKDIVKKINPQTNLIGISLNHSCQHNIAIKILKEIKKKYDLPVIIGGVHATEDAEAFLRNGFDAVILGEGEEVLYNLVKSKMRNLSKTKGIAYINKKKIIFNERAPLIKDLDTLPFPARELFPLRNYFQTKLIHSPVNHNHTPIISSRGCPMSCSFCSVPLFLNRTFRARNPKNIVDEIQECKEKYDITEFYFMDDNMTFDKQRIIDFCYELINRGLKVKWSCSTGVRSENLDKQLLLLMKKSGCNFIAVSPESGSERLLVEEYNKRISLKKIEEVVKHTNELNIRNCAYFVIGSPSETDKDKQLTLRFIKRLARNGLDEMGIFTLMSHKNTVLSKKYYDNKKNVDEWEELVQGITPKSHKDYQKIKKFKRKLYINFYLTQILYHPEKIFRIAKNFLLRKQETKTDRALLLIVKTILKQIGFKIKL